MDDEKSGEIVLNEKAEAQKAMFAIFQLYSSTQSKYTKIVLLLLGLDIGVLAVLKLFFRSRSEWKEPQMIAPRLLLSTQESQIVPAIWTKSDGSIDGQVEQEFSQTT